MLNFYFYFKSKFFSFFIFILLNTILSFNIINCKSYSFLSKLKTKVELSKIDNVITALQLGSNSPCEDKYFIQELNISNKKAYLMSVFDGHGGWVLSEYANLLFYPYFLEQLNSKINLEIKEENKIINALNKTFERIEQEFKLISYTKFIEGNKAYKKYGTCALVCLIYNNKLYTANLGDSKAILLSKNNEKDINYEYKKISKVFNARKKDEQKKLKQKWPHMDDIYICKREKVCYVKGRLQPTSTLGDFYLKTPFYNFDIKKINNDIYINTKINNYEGPFISSIPDIKIFDLTKKDKFLIIGTDGLWDYLNSKKIAKVVDKYLDDKNKDFFDNKIYENSDKIGFGLMQKIIKKSAKKVKIDINKILEMTLGKKLRRIHDDITIIILDFSKINHI